MDTKKDIDEALSKAKLVCSSCKTLCTAFKCPACGNDTYFENLPINIFNDPKPLPKLPD